MLRHRTRLVILPAALLAALLGVCVAVRPTPLFGDDSHQDAASGVWLDVPFVKQDRNACGAASIAMVMQYWERQSGQGARDGAGADTGPDTEAAAGTGSDATAIQRELYSPRARGIYAGDMQRYLQAQQFRTFAFAGQWSDLREQLQKGRPLIVALKTGHDTFHYIVVTGLDWQQGVVLTNDPAGRKLLKQDRESFEREWKATGNWTLLAIPQTARIPSR
jgi:uncharacterized protein YvpB